MELQLISEKIIELHGKRVLLDAHLASLYEVELKQLRQSIRRNMDRFPPDFMYELTNKEYNSLIDSGRSQIVTRSSFSGSYTPFAFTEQGIAMLATVLRSPKAIQVSIDIMRAFVTMRRMLVEMQGVNNRLELLEFEVQDINRILDGILNKPLPEKPRRTIGFVQKGATSQTAV